jgi:ATP-dependent DNA helicase RecG
VKEVRPRLLPESPVQYLPGVGPRRAELLAKLGIATVEDLLRHTPRRYLDARRVRRIADLVPGELCTVVARVTATQVRRRPGRQDFLARLADASGTVAATWFGRGYLARTLAAGDEIVLSGALGPGRGRGFANPEFEKLDDEERELLHAGRIIPVHPLTAGVTGKGMRRLVHTALEAVGGELVDPLPGGIRAEHDLEGLAPALRQIHFPGDEAALERARRRLAFEELFLVQVLLATRRARREHGSTGLVTATTSERARALVRALPFRLTAAQKRVIAEILADQRAPRPMHRLLVGEVGSGKTLVALVACLHAAEAGFQSAFLAPTEILAEQHFRTLERFAAAARLSVALLLGRTRAAGRREVLEGVAAGRVELLVGTHAVLQEEVRFRRLGFVVVDEQHRFGVRQRATLAAKGKTPDVLVMTATPIPRSLALALFGDLDLSVLDERPPGRGRVRTRVVPEAKRERVLEFTARELASGRQAYFVLPVIEETAKADLKAATAAHDQLTKHPLLRRFRWGLLHGRLPGEERAGVMADFAAGRLRGLVTTTVIEVGIDVPNATLLVVEQAERFGLAQLHQLRGRIGRGPHVSTCVLLPGPGASPEALDRLRRVASTEDGFRLAEEDLALRGPGELWGTLQTGLPRFRVADPIGDRELLNAAHAAARALVEEEPELEGAPLAPLRRVLEARFGEEALWNPFG